MQGAGTCSPRDDDTRLLGIPGSRGRVTALDPNYGGVSRITSPFRVRIPLSPPLQPACGPGDSGHADLPLPPPSSTLTVAVPLVCPLSRSQLRVRVSLVPGLNQTPHGTSWRRPCATSQRVRQSHQLGLHPAVAPGKVPGVDSN